MLLLLAACQVAWAEWAAWTSKVRHHENSEKAANWPPFLLGSIHTSEKYAAAFKSKIDFNFCNLCPIGPLVKQLIWLDTRQAVN